MYVMGIVLFLALVPLIVLYVFWRSGKFVDFFGGDKTKWWMRLWRIAIGLLAGYLCRTMWNMEGVILFHLLVAFLFVDLLAILLRRMFRNRSKGNIYRVMRVIYGYGILPVLIFVIVMGYGYTTMQNIQKKEYDVQTIKAIDDYKVALLTDIHYDTIQNPKRLQEKIQEINAEQPDIVLLGGDIVEEDTSKEKMEEVFAMLGRMNNRYGIYYVYGNHDRQPYTTEKTFTKEQLAETIEKNGIQILQDRYVTINDDIILAGREDAAWDESANRATSKEIFSDLSAAERKDKFMLMLDHQPVGVEENGAEGVDLQLSGHTHAGQIWPVGIVMELAGNLNYGMYHRGTCRAIVSSGVAGWQYYIRTGGQCEYVIVNLHS